MWGEARPATCLEERTPAAPPGEGFRGSSDCPRQREGRESESRAVAIPRPCGSPGHRLWFPPPWAKVGTAASPRHHFCVHA